MVSHNLLISPHRDGKIVKDAQLQKYLNNGYIRVASIEVKDGKIIIISFNSRYELMYDEFKVRWFARHTSDPLLQQWFESRESFPSFEAWLASASSI